MRALRGWGARITGGAILAASAVAIAPLLPYPTTPISVPQFFTTSAVQRLPAGSVALIAPLSAGGKNSEPDLWQAEIDFRFRMPEGYIHIPVDDGIVAGPRSTILTNAMVGIAQGSTPPPLSGATRDQMHAEMARLNVSTVIVGPMPARDQMVRFFEELLGSPPDHVGGVDVWWDTVMRRE
jgi:hypothetical protein